LKNFQNQHCGSFQYEIAKKITRKINVLSKKVSFLKNAVRESRAICTYEVRHSLDLSLLKKMAGILQNIGQPYQ